MADNHDKEQNIIEKAKEINQKVKEKQANTNQISLQKLVMKNHFL